jgi:hypothetical protein
MLNAIGDSMSDLASSQDEDDGDDEDDDGEDTWLDKLSEDDKPGWVMGTIVGMDLSVVITGAGLGLSAAQPDAL